MGDGLEILGLIKINASDCCLAYNSITKIFWIHFDLLGTSQQTLNVFLLYRWAYLSKLENISHAKTILHLIGPHNLLALQKT